MPHIVIYLMPEVLGTTPETELDRVLAARDDIARQIDGLLQRDNLGRFKEAGMATVFPQTGIAMHQAFAPEVFANMIQAMRDNMARMKSLMGNTPMDGALLPTLTAVFEVPDSQAVATITLNLRKRPELQAIAGQFGIARPMFEVGQENAASQSAEAYERPPYMGIEIYYDISSIPEKYGHPLDFRNAAMDLIEAALEEEGAGEWSGAEIGMGEVNFGFTVEDFDRAEAIVRKAVKGTDFDRIREIKRYDSEAED